MTPPPMPQAGDKPDADFVQSLLEVEQKARELRDEIATMLHLAPKNERGWFATFTEPSVCRGLGALLMHLSKSAAWLQRASDQTIGVLNASLPLLAPGLTDHFVEGQVDAEISCGCGDSDCTPCTLRNTHGVDKAREMLTKLLQPQTRKQHRRLTDPRGRPLQ